MKCNKSTQIQIIRPPSVYTQTKPSKLKEFPWCVVYMNGLSNISNSFEEECSIRISKHREKTEAQTIFFTNFVAFNLDT